MWHQLISETDILELPPVTRKLFIQFYNVAGGSVTHPNDHKRFNEFIRYCHAKRVKLTEMEFEKMLLRIGCKHNEATKLSEIYYHGRALLKTSCPYVPSGT